MNFLAAPTADHSEFRESIPSGSPAFACLTRHRTTPIPHRELPDRGDRRRYASVIAFYLSKTQVTVPIASYSTMN